MLQYPVCLLVVSHEYDLLVGPSTGLSTQVLEGSGWALGTMSQPAAGTLVWGASVDGLTDRPSASPRRPGWTGPRWCAASAPPSVRTRRTARASRPRSPRSRAPAAPLPVDEEGELVNAIVEYVEGDSGVQRVGQVCEKFAIGERSLQRLTARRIGLTLKWLIQRRRTHEAAERLTDPDRPDLARVAADLGYADQAHFGRDFRTVTGLTPGEYAAEPRP